MPDPCQQILNDFSNGNSHHHIWVTPFPRGALSLTLNFPSETVGLVCHRTMRHLLLCLPTPPPLVPPHPLDAPSSLMARACSEPPEQGTGPATALLLHGQQHGPHLGAGQKCSILDPGPDLLHHSLHPSGTPGDECVSEVLVCTILKGIQLSPSLL